MTRYGLTALMMALAWSGCASESDPEDQVAQASEVDGSDDAKREQASESATSPDDGDERKPETNASPVREDDATSNDATPEETKRDPSASDAPQEMNSEPEQGADDEQSSAEPEAEDDSGSDEAPKEDEDAGVDIAPDAAIGEGSVATPMEQDVPPGGVAVPGSSPLDAAVATELTCSELTELKADFTDAVSEVADEFSLCVYDDECVIYRAEYFSCPAPNDWLLLVGGRSYALASEQTEAFQSSFDELAGEACPDSPRSTPSCPGATGAGTLEIAACVDGSCSKVISGSNQGNPRPASQSDP